MKKIGQLLSKINIQKKTVLDEKTVFHIFRKVIKQEYGNLGEKNLIPSFYKEKKIFIQSQSSAWKNELLINQKEIIAKLNQHLGPEEIREIKFK